MFPVPLTVHKLVQSSKQLQRIIKTEKKGHSRICTLYLMESASEILPKQKDNSMDYKPIDKHTV